MLCRAYLKTFEQRRRVIYNGVGYPPHSFKLNTIMCYVRLTARHPSNDGRSSIQRLATTTLGQTQHCNVLCVPRRKTSEQRRKIIHMGVGYPPHSVKLNTITSYMRLTSKHPSNDGGSSTPGLGTLYTRLNSTLQRVTCDSLQDIPAMTKVIHNGVGYPPHSVKLNTVTFYVRLTAKHPSNDKGQSQGGWVPSTLGQTQHCNMLCRAYLKTSEQRQRIIHNGVGYPPHSVKLNTAMYYVRLVARHLSNDKMSSTPGVGYHPHSVKLNIVTPYTWLTSKNPSNDGRSSTGGLGTLHTR